MEISTTLGISRSVLKTYSPSSVEELINDYGKVTAAYKNISVVSRGNNWGYGCHAPNADDSLLISLANCNKIPHFDPYHGTITVEPGVTYGQLANFLEQNGDEWIAPVHGGGEDCSVLGNALERGYGITPNADHFNAILSLEAILKDGTLYQGSLKKLGLAKLDKLFKYGVGPYLDPLFSQSGLGIVTQITIKLAKKPEHVEIFYYFLESETSLTAAVEAIKKSKAELGSTVGGINLINRERCLSMLIDYPTDKIKENLPLSEAELRLFAQNNLITPWLVVGMIYGNKKIAKSAKKLIKKNFQKIRKRSFYFNTQNKIFYDFVLKVIKYFKIASLEKSLTSMVQTYDVLHGKPNNVALKLAYWKHENKDLVKGKNLNPNRDRCGLIWYAPLVEMKSEVVKSYVDFIKSASAKFNINALITLTTIDELCFDSTVPILFNSNSEADKKNAWDYYDFLLNEGRKLGFFPYRLNIESQKKFHLSSPMIAEHLINSSRYNA